MSQLWPQLLRQAETYSWTHMKLLTEIKYFEWKQREAKGIQRRLKRAHYLYRNPLSSFDVSSFPAPTKPTCDIKFG